MFKQSYGILLVLHSNYTTTSSDMSHKLAVGALCAGLCFTSVLLGMACYAFVKYINRRHVKLKCPVAQVSFSLPYTTSFSLPHTSNIPFEGFPRAIQLTQYVPMYIDGQLQPHRGLTRPEISMNS